jgi:hypothetical protein
MLLVEPTLHDLEPAEPRSNGAEPPLRGRACRWLEAAGYWRARSAQVASEIPVFLSGLPFGSAELDSLRRRVSAAEQRLREVGLHFFVELGLGAIVGTLSSGVACTVPGVGSFVLDATSPVESLLASAARSFLALVIEAETSRMGGLGALGTANCLGLLDLFGWSVVHEYRIRTGSCSVKEGEAEVLALGERLLAWMDRGPSCRLALELVCCWYPGWHRALFIRDSPFEQPSPLDPTFAVGAMASSPAKD